MLFQKAVKTEAKLRLAIAGPSGGGKTYTALALATHLVGESGKIALLDTEHGSAAKYADLFDFDTIAIDAPFHPDRYIEAIHAAVEAGYGVLILDSLSHAWNGPGGLLEIVDDIAKRMKTSNSFAAWKDATPIQNRFIEAMLAADLHLIATMRSKQEYVIEQVDKGNGRTISVPKKLGMAPVQRDSMEYEFDVYLEMDVDNNALVQKTRCPALNNKVFEKPGADVAGILREWLSGAPVTVSAEIEQLREKFDALGHKTYGDAWDDKRPELVSAVSKSRTRNSAHLKAAELETLIAGMEKKVENGAKKNGKATAEELAAELFD